jgi:hypothetical protein
MAEQGRAFASSKQSNWAKPDLADIDSQPGIYVGEIKQILSGSRDGSIKVYIPILGGDPDDESGWQKCTYASPFLGSTTGPNNVLQANTYEVAQQSYGFYMTPPDPGNLVLCCFPPGRGSVGVWFACLSNNMSKYSVPAAAPSTSYENIDPYSLNQGGGAAIANSIVPGVPYPVGDFNDKNPVTAKSDWIKNLRPINAAATVQLIRAGLDKDITRGAITSSVQRDPVSSVFGFNSPGRPIPSQDTKNISNLNQQVSTGTFTPPTVTARLNGHSLVLDDGDIYGKNNLVRLKTAAGHQIMMNDSEGFVYISNATGTAWVELTKEGDVLIYNSRDLSVRSSGNIQLHSDRDVMINANRYLRMKGTVVEIEGSNYTSVVGKQQLSLFGGQTSLKGRSRVAINSGGTMSLTATGGMQLKGSTIGLNSGGGGELPSPQPIPSFLSPDTIFADNQWVIRTNSLSSICYRVPTHEPYIRGNIAAVLEQQEAIADFNQQADSNITTVTGETVATQNLTSSQNVEVATASNIDNPAPASAFISQPEAAQGLGALSQDEYQAYLAQTGYTNSGGTYETVSVEGYAGRYGLSAAALESAGYLKPGTPQTLAAIDNPNNWIGGPGQPNSLNEFLTTAEYQDYAMNVYTTQNYSALQTAGVITADTPIDQTAGLMSVSHHVGPNAAVAWYTGYAIENTQQINQFYQEGRYSQNQVAIIQTSKASKTIVGAS